MRWEGWMQKAEAIVIAAVLLLVLIAYVLSRV